MNVLAAAIISTVFTFVSAWGIYNYAPLSLLEKFGPEQEQRYGATITTIAGSDTISGSRTTINTNFTNLNSDKVEVSTTTMGNLTSLPNLTSAVSLATVGTITSGTWSGTSIAVNKQGTGTTSPSRYHTIIGDGSLGFTIASSTGTSGQFWTSGGAGAYPSWTTSSINEAGTYAWTGTHSFSSATTTFNATTSHTGMFQQGEWGGIMPVGALTAYASSTPPQGWLLCNGQTVSRTIYARLFHVIGTTYGVGDGSTTFTLPDLRNRKITMASTTANIAQTGGEANHTMLLTELVAHTHTVAKGDIAAGGSQFVEASDSVGTNNTGSTGSATPFNVLDPYIAMFYIIRY